ncbi:uncharacterized protein LOC143034170 [Oratosquilla oratoria]|uniref:uncharacterized protein LOC143034170 n=1 Tax=Oratosquilla oratoria TaxID=337810 RepID=UPI003F7725A6
MLSSPLDHCGVAMAMLMAITSFLHMTSTQKILLQEHQNLLSPQSVVDIFTTVQPFQPSLHLLQQVHLPITKHGFASGHHHLPLDDQSLFPGQVSLRQLQTVRRNHESQNITRFFDSEYSKQPGRQWGVPEDEDDIPSGSYWRSLVNKVPSGHIKHSRTSRNAVADKGQGAHSSSSQSTSLRHQRLQQIPRPRLSRLDSPLGNKSPREASAQLSRWLLWDPLVQLLKMSLSKDSECRTKTGLQGVCRLGTTCTSGEAKEGLAPIHTCDNGYGTCCINQVSCGDVIKVNKTYFTTKTSTSGTCPVKVSKISSEICHLRLDLTIFRLKGATLGSCQRDVFLVSGHNVNSFVPKLCGNNDGQHLYVDVDMVSGPLELNVITVGEGLQRRVDVLITQIPCNSAHRPLPNCLQYYTGAQGFFASFNYGQNGTDTYLNDMNYAVCLRKEAGFCSIIYSTDDLTMSTTYKFEVVNYIITAGTATSIVPAGEAGVGVESCPDDFLVLGGTRLCGDRLNNGRDPLPSNNAPVTDMTNGPFIVQFQSNSESVGGGFRLSYQQHPC